MHRLRTTRALFGWTVLVAFLFGLFTPVLSHAMALATAQPPSTYLSEICSASGTRHVLVVDDAGETTAPPVPDMSHCDLCCSHQHAAMAPPPYACALLVASLERDPYPPLFYQAPRPQFAWTAAQSRGPPSSLS
jgi:hypothetical protein